MRDSLEGTSIHRYSDVVVVGVARPSASASVGSLTGSLAHSAASLPTLHASRTEQTSRLFIHTANNTSMSVSTEK